MQSGCVFLPLWMTIIPGLARRISPRLCSRAQANPITRCLSISVFFFRYAFIYFSTGNFKIIFEIFENVFFEPVTCPGLHRHVYGGTSPSKDASLSAGWAAIEKPMSGSKFVSCIWGAVAGVLSGVLLESHRFYIVAISYLGACQDLKSIYWKLVVATEEQPQV